MLLQIIQTYLFLVNVLGFVIMYLDKRKARRGAWRISESSLLTVAVLGGSIGVFLGMYLFRHKTRKLKFVMGIPLILAFQAFLILQFYKNL